MSDVVVAGGGLIGLSIAWRCVQRGLTVTVVDEDPGTGASFAAAGMLAPVTEVSYGEESLLRLCLASLQRYPAFVAEVEGASGRTVGYRTAGTLAVGFDEDDVRALEALRTFQQELGLGVERLTPREARRREPSLTPRLRGAVQVTGDLSVDARALHAALLAAGVAAGVRLVRARVAAVRSEAGRAVGLRLHGGEELTAGAVVLALGAHSGLLPGAPQLPIRPVKGQILRLGGAEGLLTGTVRALVRGRPVYLVPYGEDRLIVGATVEDRGFDPRVTAGGVHDLLRDAIEVVPGITELALLETIARWRPATPDNAPVLGSSGLPGLLLAAGHHRNGVLLTPVTAELITEQLVSGSLPELGAPFGIDRFSKETTRCR